VEERFCSKIAQFENEVSQLFCVAGVQLGSPSRQFAKSLNFWRSASVQPLFSKPRVQSSLLRGMAPSVPHAAYFEFRPAAASPRWSQVAELEFEFPHPTAKCNKSNHGAIRRMASSPSARGCWEEQTPVARR
jgi:hypothetical protein